MSLLCELDTLASTAGALLLAGCENYGRAPKRNGLLVVGSKGLDAFDRFTLGSVSTKLIQHASCPVLVVKGEAAPLQRITLAIDGSDASAKALTFVLSKFQPDRSISKGGRR